MSHLFIWLLSFQTANAALRSNEALRSPIKIGELQNQRLALARVLPRQVVPEIVTILVKYGRSELGEDPYKIRHDNSEYIAQIKDPSQMAELTVENARYKQLEGPIKYYVTSRGPLKVLVMRQKGAKKYWFLVEPPV